MENGSDIILFATLRKAFVQVLRAQRRLSVQVLLFMRSGSPAISPDM
jgi:hypothetical protein